MPRSNKKTSRHRTESVTNNDKSTSRPINLNTHASAPIFDNHLFSKVKHGTKSRPNVNVQKTFRILDLFCGTGGFSYGFKSFHRSFEVVCAVDILKHAVATASANHSKCTVLEDDIRNIKPSHVKRLIGGQNIDLVIGGPPCQGFSSLRPFRSATEEDPRNSLFEQFALFVNYFQPRVFVMENVVGLLTFKNGKVLQAIINCFSKIGYSVDWRVLNAANFGVPQKRERLIMIGRRDGGQVLFPDPTHSYEGRGVGYKDRRKMITKTSGLRPALTVLDAISDLPEIGSGAQAEEYLLPPQNDYQKARRKGVKELALHTAANHNQKILEIIRHAGENISCIPKRLVTSGFSSCYSRMNPNEPANTITVKFTSPASSKCIHPFQDRAITPREAARIQSFDDNFKFCGSKTDIAAQLGNAVPPLLGRAVARSVFEILTEPFE